RELLPVLQLDHDVTRKLSRRLRVVTARLGAVRELDVLLLLIDELHVSRRDRGPALERMRIATSKARDAARTRLFDHLPLPELRSMLATLKRAQGVLGRMHDLQVLIDRARDVQASIAPPQIAVWGELDVLVVALDEDCRRLHARYMRSRDRLVALATALSTR